MFSAVTKNYDLVTVTSENMRKMLSFLKFSFFTYEKSHKTQHYFKLINLKKKQQLTKLIKLQQYLTDLDENLN